MTLLVLKLEEVVHEPSGWPLEAGKEKEMDSPVGLPEWNKAQRILNFS